MVAVKVLNMTRILNNTSYGTRKEAHFPKTKPNYTQTRTQTETIVKSSMTISTQLCSNPPTAGLLLPTPQPCDHGIFRFLLSYPVMISVQAITQTHSIDLRCNNSIYISCLLGCQIQEKQTGIYSRKGMEKSVGLE
jgi:hypothetical protein